MSNNALRVVPADEECESLNVYKNGVAVAQVERWVTHDGAGFVVTWNQLGGPYAVDLSSRGTGTATYIRGDQTYIRLCRAWWQTNEILIAKRYANERASWNWGAPLPFPGIGTWAQDAARDEAQVLAEVSG